MTGRRAARYDVPDAFARPDSFAPLRDHNNRAYTELPCTGSTGWDEDAPDVDQQFAAAICREECPAILACMKRAGELGPLASGVWGGIIIVSTPEDSSPVYDATVAAWMRDAGISPQGSTDAIAG